MATFVRHEPCPRCGSRDNLARYSDGSGWCFGCHYVISSSGESSVAVDVPSVDDIKLPLDCSTSFPEHVVNWLRKYDVTIEEALKHGWKYSKHWDQLIFPFYGENESQLTLWQGRNFGGGQESGPKRRKYYNQGRPADILPIFRAPQQENKCRSLVVVEDVLSAVRIARQSDAMPCLGSYLPAKKLMRLRAFYETIVIWLDADKIKEAREIADMAKWIGFRTKVVYTDLDPKEYSDEEITKKLV